MSNTTNNVAQDALVKLLGQDWFPADGAEVESNALGGYTVWTDPEYAEAYRIDEEGTITRIALLRQAAEPVILD